MRTDFGAGVGTGGFFARVRAANSSDPRIIFTRPATRDCTSSMRRLLASEVCGTNGLRVLGAWPLSCTTKSRVPRTLSSLNKITIQPHTRTHTHAHTHTEPGICGKHRHKRKLKPVLIAVVAVGHCVVVVEVVLVAGAAFAVAVAAPAPAVRAADLQTRVRRESTYSECSTFAKSAAQILGTCHRT